MNRPVKNHTDDSTPAIDPEREEVASLAAKTAALSHRLELSAGKVAGSADPRPKVPSLTHRIFVLAVYLLVCLVTLLLLTIATLRILYHDGTHLLTWLNAFTRYIYLPAYLCLAWAVWKRRWWLAVANLAVISLHIAWIEPDFVRDDRFDVATNNAAPNAPPAPHVRIFFANVRTSNTEYDALLQEIVKADPDVIVLVEFTYLWHMAYLHSPVIAAYPYGEGLRNDRLGTVNVFSRLPLKSERQAWIAGRAIDTLEIPLGSETLHLIGLHAPRPMAIRDDNYEAYWDRVVPMILNVKGPLVVVGDFNATQYSRVYQLLTSQRLRSAHQERGRGYATSWPNGQYCLPPIRIDQALLSPDVECIGIREGEGRGSDHKPFILDVELPPKR
jgi:endonuclease/exonuclease/phosphatase (EEP) superfamily protein YafD